MRLNPQSQIVAKTYHNSHRAYGGQNVQNYEFNFGHYLNWNVPLLSILFGGGVGLIDIFGTQQSQHKERYQYSHSNERSQKGDQQLLLEMGIFAGQVAITAAIQRKVVASKSYVVKYYFQYQQRDPEAQTYDRRHEQPVYFAFQTIHSLFYIILFPLNLYFLFLLKNIWSPD